MKISDIIFIATRCVGLSELIRRKQVNVNIALPNENIATTYLG
jgi:hypothetical protein